MAYVFGLLPRPALLRGEVEIRGSEFRGGGQGTARTTTRSPDGVTAPNHSRCFASAFFYQERRPKAAYASPRKGRGEGEESAAGGRQKRPHPGNRMGPPSSLDVFLLIRPERARALPRWRSARRPCAGSLPRRRARRPRPPCGS